MRLRVAFVLAAFCACPNRGAGAQHSPQVARTLEVGGELILADDLTALAGIVQLPVGRSADARFGAGAADPDESDTDAFLRTGLRAFVAERSPRFPFDAAVEGELDVFIGQDNTVKLTGGPSFGVARARGETVLAYVQPLFLYEHAVGRSDVKLGVRVGADYVRSPAVDLRGDLVISSEMQLRAALYFRPGPLRARPSDDEGAGTPRAERKTR